MKKTRILALLVAGMFVLAAGPVFAQSVGWTTDDVIVTINANMPELTQLRFVEGNTTLNLVEPAAVTIGTVYERSNNLAGYTVTLASANSGTLLGEESDESVAYSLTYGGATINLSSGSANVTTAVGRTSFNGVARVVVVTPEVDQEADFLAADDYSDTLTFTILGE